MFEVITLILLTLGAVLFAAYRLLQYLRFLQQEEYKPQRFLNWLRERRAFDTKGSALLLLVAAVLFLSSRSAVLSVALSLLAAVGLFWLGWREADPRKQGKIRLVMTERAGWIYRVALGLLFLAGFVCGMLCYLLALAPFLSALVLLLVVQAPPLLLNLSVMLLRPAEERKQQRLLDEAKRKFLQVNPHTIGITGSYGKTSTKSILGVMLDTALAPTFWPQKGINTPMGITREIRERLKPSHKYAVVEMGAYHIGSIKRLCELTPPTAALVTAVGLMHLERFGGAEEIYQAKSELVRAIPEGGLFVVNGDNPGSRRMAEENTTKNSLLYGLDPSLGHLDIWVDTIKYSVEGSSFRIHWQDKTFDAFTPLHGRPAISNILGAFAMSLSLGADPEYLLAVIRNLTPVNNRLEVVRIGGGIQINDAYNSNPAGFRAALEILQSLPGDSKILMTPGMIELGSEQNHENKKIGEIAASICDFVLVVGDENREALIEGLKSAGFSDEKLFLCKNREQAFSRLSELRSAGSVVLIENDLPDLFEMDVRF